MYFSLIGFLYIIIVGSLCHFLPIPEIVKGFLALPGFLIIPYLFGTIFVPKKKIEKYRIGNKEICHVIIVWMIGFIFLTLGATILKGINLVNLYYYIAFIFAVIGIKISYSLYCQKRYFAKIVPISSFIRAHYKEVIIVTLIIFISISLQMGTTPFPTKNGGDIFFFSFDVHQTIKHSVFYQYSVYFSYHTLFVSLLSIIFNLHPYTLFWTGAWVLFFCFGFGIYLLSYRISNNKFFSSITVLFAIFPVSLFVNLSAFQPQLWIYVMLPYAIFVIRNFLQGINKIKLKNLTKTSIISLIIIFISYIYSFKLVLIHPNRDAVLHVLYFILTWVVIVILLRIIFNTKDSISIGTVFACLIMLHHPTSFLAIIFLTSYIGLYFLRKYSISYFYVVSIILVLCIIIAIIFHIPASIRSTDIFAHRAYYFGYMEKIEILSTSLSLGTVFLFVIGSSYIILRRQIEYYSFVVISFIILFIYLIDIDMLIRALYFFIIPAVFVASMGFMFVSKLLYHMYYRKEKSIVLVLLLAIIVICGLSPILTYVNDIQSIGGISLQTFTKEEYNAAIFLEKKFPNAVIISDFWTQLIFSGLSGAQNVQGSLITDRILVSSDSFQSYELSKMFCRDFSKNEKEDVFPNQILEIMVVRGFDINFTRKDLIIIITPRTIRHIDIGTGKKYLPKTKSKADIEPLRFITSDTVNTNSPQIKKFFNSTYFTLLYHDSEIYVFGVNPEPGAPFKLQNNTK